MKALSLRPDYALEVMTWDKRAEFRTWSTNYRGYLLICATAEKIPGTIPGHALVVVRLKEITKLGDRDYAWLFDQLRTIEPFPVKGRQHIFNVDDDLIKYHPELDFENEPTDDLMDAYYNQYVDKLIYDPNTDE